jgi:hypothetical protein
MESALHEDIKRIAVADVVGGHGRKAAGAVDDGKSFLTLDNWLYKPFQAPAKVESELRFFNEVLIWMILSDAKSGSRLR